MLFNSFTFLIFFAVVYPIYLALRNHLTAQNRFLLLASCVFYGWWDWRFLGLMWGTILLDYYMGLLIHRSNDSKRRKFLLTVSIVCNMAVLGFFKYFNFFQENLIGLLHTFGVQADPHLLNVILPIGVSFYTFQSMSYTIDVYRKELIPAHHLLDFAVFVTYFPHLVAGPILRATKLLPQVLNPRIITRDQFNQGCYLIFWGLFQKIFVADNLAKIADPIFNSAGPYSAYSTLIAVYAFAFQILCDFSGYSDIARGLGKLMGFDIVINFNLPYFAANPSDFWQRWHISLSTWLRDYLYIPMGGNRSGVFKTYRNLFLVMLIGGLWHGAAWGFVIWGAYHGLLLIFHRLLQPALSRIQFPEGSASARVWQIVRIVFFFHLVCIGWLFFRSQSLIQAVQMVQSLAAGWALPGFSTHNLALFLYCVTPLFLIHLYQYKKNDLLALLQLPAERKLLFGLLAFCAFLYIEIMFNSVNQGGPREFIYFQF